MNESLFGYVQRCILYNGRLAGLVIAREETSVVRRALRQMFILALMSKYSSIQRAVRLRQQVVRFLSTTG